MKSARKFLSAIVVVSVAIAAGLCFGEASEKKLPIFDNMFYKGKPGTAPYGLIPSKGVFRFQVDRRSKRGVGMRG